MKTGLVRGVLALQSEMKELKGESTWYLEMAISGAVGMVKLKRNGKILAYLTLTQGSIGNLVSLLLKALRRGEQGVKHS